MARAKMLSGVRLGAAALLLAAVLAWTAYSLGRSQATYDLQDQEYAQKQTREAASRIKRECAVLSGPAFAKCEDEIIDARDQRENSQGNLSAQRKVANGTTRFFILGVLELALTFWGILVLKDQLAATRKAISTAGKANRIFRKQAKDTRKANAALVRPHVAIEKLTIEFDNSKSPTVRLITRNGSNFTAHDWEWQPLLKYRVGARDEFQSRLFPWFPRGVHGVDLSPGDHGPRLPVAISFSLNQLPDDHIAALESGAGLQISLTVFTRCYDDLGNAVDDKHHFLAVAHNIVGAGSGYQIPLERVPAGTQIEGQEDKVPE